MSTSDTQLQNKYSELWQTARSGFEANEFELDTNIDDSSDSRRGITCLVKLKNSQVSKRVLQFHKQAQQLEPEQYYYPESDLHLTVMSIISCIAGFHIKQINSACYIEKVRDCLTQVAPFDIEFRGITASPSCIMLQGFPLGDEIERVRRLLRQNFKHSKLLNSIDSRYTINTYHSTVIRMRRPISKPKSFLRLLDSYRDHHFGRIRINGLELVFNDWYQRKALTQKLADFKL
ncbi:hypothetical protein [Agaribacterium sp. ZY112]|uniref:hypothetical protein n=1 Tax=Agaribacterium sp. ZY112 TaxID=3233574 RepID=UPI00352510FC